MAETTDKPKFSYEQYELLLCCSKKGDMREWNLWREHNPSVEIQLEGAILRGAHLQGAALKDAHLQGADLLGADLQGAKLWGAQLHGAVLEHANLHGAELRGANLQGARLWEADLQRTDLSGADLQGAKLWGVKLQGAVLEHANLQGAGLRGADLQMARLWEADLRGARLRRAKLQGALLNLVRVDGSTIVTDCRFDARTDFTGVGLDSCIIDPGLKVALRNNIRHKEWGVWLQKGSAATRFFKNLTVRPFWWMTDYGRSTARIVYAFWGLVFFFTLIYTAFEMLPGLEGILKNLRIGPHDPWYLLLGRAGYFSIVTMTTLGFGDISAADRGDIFGLVSCGVVSLQVILGYMILGALITRLGILFTSDAPTAEPNPPTAPGELRETTTGQE
jgi:uncharacterized protein YjbI with pentapeptide repeats